MNESDTPRVAVAMSGGTDSSVAALLLREKGYDVFGITALLVPGERGYGSVQAVSDARAAAAGMGIEHRTVDLRDAFEKHVVTGFIREYRRGRTPSPCVVCNSRIKFGLLMDEAFRLGAERLATGHYARRIIDWTGTAGLVEGADVNKDQSYFLCRLTQTQVSSALFPVGDMTAGDVVSLAREHGLLKEGRKSSQELCFVGDADYAEWLDDRLGGCAGMCGDIIDAEGRKLGVHDGIHRFTVGQRRGLGVYGPEPSYVTGIDPERGAVIVGQRCRAMARGASVEDMSWIAGVPPGCRFKSLVRIRYSHPGTVSDVTIQDDGTARIEFGEPQFAVAPGQAAAFYRGNELLGGGWISGSRQD